MIREPYGVYPYNTTIDISQTNEFSLIFNGDELESYQYEIAENNSTGSALVTSSRLDNPNIYNNDTLAFPVGGSSLSSLLGKNLLWRVTLWENNAFLKNGSYKPITRTTTEVAPTVVYLQDESAILDGVNLTASNIIANITIRGERRRIISYNSTDKSVTVSNKFSFTPTYNVSPDTYIIYTNYTKSGSTVTPQVTATIPVLGGLVVKQNASTSIVETGVIPILENITDLRLQQVVVNIDMGNNVVIRISKYTKYEYLFDYDEATVIDNIQYYNVLQTRKSWTNGQTSPTVTTTQYNYPTYKITYADLENYEDYVTAQVNLASALPSAPAAGVGFNIYRNYYDTNYYYFKARSSAIVTIDNWPADYASAFPSRFYNFIGSYRQDNNIPIKYHIWEVYDITKSDPIYRTDKIFDSDLQFAYDNFENNHTYKIKIIVTNQDDAVTEYLSPELIITYNSLNFKTSGEAKYNERTYSVDVLWPDNRLSVPTLVDGRDGGFNYFFDYIREEKQNLNIPRGTQYRYDNISGGKLIFDSTNFMFSTFIAINDPGPKPWSGELIRLNSNPSANRISLIRDEYKLRIECSDETAGGTVSYDFSKSKKMSEGNFVDLREPFNLLEIVLGEQIGILEGGSYRPLTKEEKLGYAYYWQDKNPDTAVDYNWTDPYFWTETDSDTNCMVYKLLIYPDRAELYPMLRWVGLVSGANNTQIILGHNNLLVDRGNNECLLMIGDEIRQIVDYNITSGIAIVDSPFSTDVTNKKFLCYYKNGENATADNVYVAPFTQRNSAPFNQISLFGDLEYYYMTLYTKKNFRASEIHDMLEYFFVEKWTDENQGDTLLNATFDGSLTSKYYDGIESEIYAFRIYRETYLTPESNTPFESILIADVPYSELSLINNNTTLYITDYTVRNRGIFKYSILPLTNTVIGVRIETNKIATDWYEWIFTSIGRVRDNIYRPIEQWVFKLNIQAGTVNHNVDRVFYRGFARYPKASIGRANYITTSLRCLVSHFDYQIVYEDDFLMHIGEGKISQNTTDVNNRKVYIQPTSAFDGVDLTKSFAYLFINKQQRRIDYYGQEGVGQYAKYFVIIEEPYLHFMPNTQDPDTNHYDIYANFLPPGYDETPIVVDRRIIFDDSIERINGWNRFVNTDEPILIRDMKGNVFIGIIHDNTEQTDIKIDDFPTEINFNMTQIADANDYLIFDV